jgi:arylsulfatase A-like enzyme
VRTLRTGTRVLGELAPDQPFFLAVDAFDPQDAYEAPRVYVRESVVDRLGLKDMRDNLVPTRFSNDVADDLGKRWGKAVEAMDDGVGKLLDRLDDLGLADNTLVVLIGDHGVALGEHGYIGKAAPTSHRLSHEVAFMVRHPNGEMQGDESSWYASTHDVAPTILSYLGVTAPGKVDGEDLTQLFEDVEDEDLPKRLAFTSVSGPVMLSGDKRYLAVVDRDAQERWLYDDEEEDDHTRFENAAGDNPDDLQRLSEALGFAAGGTLPEWGPDGTERPLPEQADDDVDGDGIRNDDDPINDDDEGDDDYKDDDTRAGALDGGDPTGKVGNFLGGGTAQPPTGQRGRYFSGDTPIP